MTASTSATTCATTVRYTTMRDSTTRGHYLPQDCEVGMTRPSLSSEWIRYFIVDRSSGIVRVVLQDGSSSELPLGEEFAALSSQIATSVFDWDRWWIINTTVRGHVLVAEAYSPITEDPIRGRPIVYLDQNHWSTIATAFAAPERIRSESLRAAARLIARLAHDGKIITPLSAAHLRETGALSGERRYELGVAMASLAGGWQFRHPLEIWRNELAQSIAKYLGIQAPIETSLPVVTLEPNALLDDNTNAHAMDIDDPRLFLLAMTSPSATLELLLEPKAMDRIEPEGWVARQRDLSSALAQSPKNNQVKKQNALVFTWIDNLQPINEALQALDETPERLAGISIGAIREILGSTPMVNRFSRLMAQRHISATTRWKPNDLTDLMFLSAAAAYADYVVAEKQTGTELAQLEVALGQQPTTFNRLELLADQLEHLR
ncbi:hypothetical protein [Chryseoglobus sp. 28M-23]|uniref:hypothetical protein n=1 Tax=Chryseoglobus sp. 28M-23 TaxID=2772253 RepID=UPI001746D05D|nr:hypothetical protein [Chryseoglobus sp. 28M-23]QOD93526.1 hypothetical protein IE160_11595 [Chryseoglobus sp. 28M-23]